MSENAALVKYYADLSIIQYADKPKARAFMENLLGALICYDLAVSVRDGFNIETAVGDQLDIIAKYVGVSRVITGTSFSRDYFGFAEYGDTTPFTFYGFTQYGAAPEDVQYRNYKESSQSIYALNDEELRIIIKLAILRNNSNASVKGIDILLNALFGAEVYYIDRMNMTVVSYMLSTAYQRIFNIAKSSGLLPNPAGVGTSLIVVPNINKIFSFSLYGGAKPTFAIGYVDYVAKWAISGGALFVSYNGITSMADLSSTRIASYNYIAESLQAYDFNGTDWMAVGDSLHVSGGGFTSMASLSSLRIVFYNTASKVLQTYDFDGADWMAIGNALSVNGGGFTSMASLSSTRIVLYNYTLGVLQTYDFDGTDWMAAGNALSIVVSTRTSMASLSSTRVAFYNPVAGTLRAYDFDGTNWIAIGNALSIAIDGYTSMASLSSTIIALCNSANSESLQTYDFDGTDWAEVGNALPVSADARTSMTPLSSTMIAFYNYTLGTLQSYDFSRDLTGCMASYS